MPPVQWADLMTNPFAFIFVFEFRYATAFNDTNVGTATLIARSRT